MHLEELIKEVLINRICVSGVHYDPENDTLVYRVEGFSKSGYAELSEVNGKILCKTRYNQVDEINSFDDLVNVAYQWNSYYCDREPFGWDTDWSPIFVKYGLLREVTETVTHYERT
jgi:hypothetical protein